MEVLEVREQFWKNLEKGIQFENTELVLPWGIPVCKLNTYGNPYTSEPTDRVNIIWSDMSLLNINRGWGLYYFVFEPNKAFSKIETWYLGDESALKAYDELKKHIIGMLGNPTIVDEVNYSQKGLRWQNGIYYVDLYLFEMHAFRCVLSIGVTSKKPWWQFWK